MYDELIRQLNPLPNLILDWYSGQDIYSEGDVEDKIIQIIAETPPDDYVEAIYANFDWSTFYHLTHVRQNILNWYPLKPIPNYLRSAVAWELSRICCVHVAHMSRLWNYL